MITQATDTTLPSLRQKNKMMTPCRRTQIRRPIITSRSSPTRKKLSTTIKSMNTSSRTWLQLNQISSRRLLKKLEIKLKLPRRLPLLKLPRLLQTHHQLRVCLQLRTLIDLTVE